MMGWMAPLRHLGAKVLVGSRTTGREPSMNEITTVGLQIEQEGQAPNTTSDVTTDQLTRVLSEPYSVVKHLPQDAQDREAVMCQGDS